MLKKLRKYIRRRDQESSGEIVKMEYKKVPRVKELSIWDQQYKKVVVVRVK